MGRPGNEAVQLASQNVHLDMTLHALVLVSTTTVYRWQWHTMCRSLGLAPTMMKHLPSYQLCKTTFEVSSNAPSQASMIQHFFTFKISMGVSSILAMSMATLP